MNVTHPDFKGTVVPLFIAFATVLLLIFIGSSITDDSVGEVQIYQTGEAGPKVTWKYSRYSNILTFEGTGEMYDYEIQTEDPQDPRKDIPKWSNLNATHVTFGEGITYIGKSALRYNHNVNSVSLPSTLVSIGQNAFSGTAISTISFPASLESIGTMAFSNTDLVDVVIPDHVTYLGPSAFAKCLKLKSLKIGAGIREIQQGLFANTPKLEYVELGPNTQTINRWLTTDSGLTSLYIPASVIWISTSAFSARSSDNIMEVNVDPDNRYYASIDGVLYNNDCTELIRYLPGSTETSFTMPDSVLYLSDNAFLYSENLLYISLSENLQYIGSDAFSYCISLKELIIPDSVTQVAKNGVSTGGTLDLLSFGTGITDVDGRSFPSLSDVRRVEFSEAIRKIDTGLLHRNASLEYVEVHKDSVYYSSAFGILYNANMSQLLATPSMMEGTLTLPESVTHIADHAFDGSNLDYVFLSGSIHVIGNGSFSNASINSIIIPDTVTIIGNNAFEGCGSLRFVYFVADTPPSIGVGAFDTGGELRVYSSMQRGFIDSYYGDATPVSYHESEVFYSNTVDRILREPVYIVIIMLVIALGLIVSERLVARRTERK